MEIILQKYIDNKWVDAALLTIPDSELTKGVESRIHFEYLPEYVYEYASHPGAAISVRYPVNYELIHEHGWLPFLYDLLPSGAGRRNWINRLALGNDSRQVDSILLREGAHNPIGDLRVKPGEFTAISHPGFLLGEITERGEMFIDYAREHGASLAGISDTQGDAPKYCLAKDFHNRWHADGVLSEELIEKHYIIKFPRNRLKESADILQAEYLYYVIATKLGLYTGEQLEINNQALIIPRFDRIRQNGKAVKVGVESLFSAAGIRGYGIRVDHKIFCDVILKYSTDPKKDIVEYIRRDIANLAFGNPDNHGRNTAFLKTGDGAVRLSPLYDFAPMFYDPDRIVRMTFWKDCGEPGALPDWGKIASLFEPGCKSIKIFQMYDDMIERISDKAILKQLTVSENMKVQIDTKMNEMVASLKHAMKNKR